MTRTKCVIVGLDGATFDLITPWVREGYLPNLGRLMEQGVYGYLRSTIPFISAPAWVSFLTGQNPGRHGIFGFRSYDLSKYTCYDEKFVTSAKFAGNTIFDSLSKNHRIASVCVPMTYPVWSINGEMIAGFPAPPSGAFTYPASLALDVPTVGMPGDFHTWSTDRKIDRSHTVLENRLRVTLDYLDGDLFDVVMVVFNNPDDANHHFWKFVDPDNPDYSPESNRRYGWVMQDLYECCDKAVGDILAKLDDQDWVFILSDHGGMPSPKLYFNTNHWLSEMKLLQPKKSGPRITDLSRELLRRLKESIPYKERIRSIMPQGALETISSVLLDTRNVDWTKTRAYRVPVYANFEGIEINVAGRQPQGIVADEGEFEELCHLIIEAVLQIKGDDGEKIVRRAIRKEVEYSGPYVDNAPDIILEMDERYCGGPSLTPPLVQRVPDSFLRVWGGAHSLEGIFVAAGPAIRSGVKIEGARIQDIAPTLLYALHEVIPEQMDGKVLQGIFIPTFLEANAIRKCKRGLATVEAATGLSRQEEELIESRLRGMGYL